MSPREHPESPPPHSPGSREDPPRRSAGKMAAAARSEAEESSSSSSSLSFRIVTPLAGAEEQQALRGEVRSPAERRAA